MKKPLLPLLIVAFAPLAGCEPAPPTETVESLAADPERLKTLREQCRTQRHKVGDELCARVAQATNQRFFGDGETPYTPPQEAPKF